MVVPYVGTWIEISALWRSKMRGQGRSLRGNVDRNLTLTGEYPVRSAVVPYVGTWIEI